MRKKITTGMMAENIKKISDIELQYVIYRLRAMAVSNKGSESYPHIYYLDGDVRVGYADEETETMLLFWWGNDDNEKEYVLDIPERILKIERFRESLRNVYDSAKALSSSMIKEIPEEGMWVEIDCYPSYELTIRVTSDGRFYKTDDTDF